MKKPTIPSNETERLKALKKYEILDSMEETIYDDITKIASQICNTPIALVSLIDEDRQWFKSHHGLAARETPRDWAYCAHAINEPDKIMEVSDALHDERFHDNPLAIGEPHVVFYAGAPLTDDEGYTLGTLCVIDHEKRNLSDQQKESLWALSRQVVTLLKLRKESILRKKIDQDFSTLVDNLGDGIFELDENGTCTYANHKMLDMLNREIEDVINTSIWEMIYHEDVEEMKRFYGIQFRNKSEKCSYEYRIKPVDGDPLWVSQNTTMEYDGNRMVRLRSISRDISENKKLKEELEEKESLHQLVSENSRDLIALHEVNGIYKYVSLAAKDLVGYDASELIGKDPYDFMHPDDIDRLRNGAHEDTLEGKHVSQIEYRFKRKDGSYIWLESYTKPIFDDNGKIISFQTSSRDISIKKAEREQLEIAKLKAEEASEAKANFLSMMSHEVRTPLNGIVGTTHLLLNKSPTKTQLSHLKILEQSSNSLMAIVNDILDFSKIEEGKILIDHSTFHLKDSLLGIYDHYKILGDEKGVDISLRYDPLLSDYYIGDSVRINQVLHNLLSNAIKFTPQGEVHFSVAKNASHDNYDEILFKVKDTGIGIAKDKQNEIFEVFIQADKTTTRKFGGSGLGLSITKRILELMNSDIHLDSTPEKGSEFSFKLVLQRASPSEAANRNLPNTTDLEALNAAILLVEDNPFNRAIAKDFLESWKCTVLEAENGEKALSILSKQSFDLVLLDLQMPVMDGYDTIKAIRSHPNNSIRQLPVVALTATAMGDVESKVYQSGMDGFITKPFHPSDFYQKIQSHLAKDSIKSSRSIKTMILDKLGQTLGRDPKEITKYFNIFVETLKEESFVLKRHIEDQDLMGIRAYAHKNKSSLILGGLNDLSSQAERIEVMIDKKMPSEMILEKSILHLERIEQVLKQLEIE